MVGVSFETGRRKAQKAGCPRYTRPVSLPDKDEVLLAPNYVKIFDGLNCEGEPIYHAEYPSNRVRFPKFTQIGTADLIGENVRYKEVNSPVVNERGFFIFPPFSIPNCCRRLAKSDVIDNPLEDLAEELYFVFGKPIAVNTQGVKKTSNYRGGAKQVVHIYTVNDLDKMVVNGGPNSEELTGMINSAWKIDPRDY
jgi:hypothetical protein